MNKKDMAPIRRRLNPDKNHITCIRGCFVNDEKEPVCYFNEPMINMGKEDQTLYLSLFKKLFSGMEGQNLIYPEFSPEQVMDGPEHRILTALRDTHLQDDSSLDYFFDKVRSSYEGEGCYVILLLHDTYDVPHHHADGSRQEDAATNLFSYVLCAICPVKLQSGGLIYTPAENSFRAGEGNFIVQAPSCGFMFPAFEEGGADIYKALFYTKDTGDNRESLIDAVFGTPVPPPAKEQKQMIGSLLENSLQDECSCEVVQAVQDKVIRSLEVKKEEKDPEPPVISLNDLSDTLRESGVSEEKVEAFRESYQENLGLTATVPAVNIAPPRQFEMRTPDVVIRVSPERSDLVETRVIDGLKYILIRAEDGVEVNGVNISIR